jgi:ferric-dicitrate binding protein FerR (iron transport regulator)
LVFVIATGHARADAQPGLPLGQVQIDGAVEVRSGSRTIALVDSSYAYFAGDQLATRARSRAVLTLGDGRVIFAAASAASVTAEGGAYRILLERGALDLRFGPSSSFEVEIGDVRIRPRVKEGSDALFESLVAVDEPGGFSVVSRRGSLELRDASGNPLGVVAAGEGKSFIRERSPGEGEGEGIDVAGEGGDTYREVGIRVAALVALAGVSLGLVELVDDDDDDDPVASP